MLAVATNSTTADIDDATTTDTKDDGRTGLPGPNIAIDISSGPCIRVLAIETTHHLPPPLVLVVEDDDRSRELVEEAFTDQNCRVIAVGDPDQAVWELRSSPGIDLLFTDVKLRPDDDDTSGMRLGDYLKSTRPEVPVAVYSTVFHAGELDAVLSESAQSRFEVVLPRGGPKWGDHDVMNRCVDIAAAYRDKRYEDAAREAHMPGSEGSVSKMRVLRQFVVGEEAPTASDHLLRRSGYTLRLLDARYGDLRGPIAVWVLEHGEQVSAELYQWPQLHAVGQTVPDALDKLATILRAQLDAVVPGRAFVSPGEGSIPWLMLQPPDNWDRLAEDIESRD